MGVEEGCSALQTNLSCQIYFVNEVFFWRQCVYNCHPRYTPSNILLPWQLWLWTFSFQSHNKYCNYKETLEKMYTLKNGSFLTLHLTSSLLFSLQFCSMHLNSIPLCAIVPVSMMPSLLQSVHMGSICHWLCELHHSRWVCLWDKDILLIWNQSAMGEWILSGHKSQADGDNPQMWRQKSIALTFRVGIRKESFQPEVRQIDVREHCFISQKTGLNQGYWFY